LIIMQRRFSKISKTAEGRGYRRLRPAVSFDNHFVYPHAYYIAIHLPTLQNPPKTIAVPGFPAYRPQGAMPVSPATKVDDYCRPPT